MGFGFWILDFGFRVFVKEKLRFSSKGPNLPTFWPEIQISRICDFGFWVLDFGFRVKVLVKSKIRVFSKGQNSLSFWLEILKSRTANPVPNP